MAFKYIRSFALVRNIAGTLCFALPNYANVRHTAGTLLSTLSTLYKSNGNHIPPIIEIALRANVFNENVTVATVAWTFANPKHI